MGKYGPATDFYRPFIQIRPAESDCTGAFKSDFAYFRRMWGKKDG